MWGVGGGEVSDIKSGSSDRRLSVYLFLQQHLHCYRQGNEPTAREPPPRPFHPPPPTPHPPNDEWQQCDHQKAIRGGGGINKCDCRSIITDKIGTVCQGDGVNL